MPGLCQTRSASYPYRISARRPPLLRAQIEHGRIGLVAEGPGGEVGELQDFYHLGIVDLVGGVGGLVIVGMEAGEPPHSWDATQGERELITAEKDVERS